MKWTHLIITLMTLTLIYWVLPDSWPGAVRGVLALLLNVFVVLPFLLHREFGKMFGSHDGSTDGSPAKCILVMFRVSHDVANADEVESEHELEMVVKLVREFMGDQSESISRDRIIAHYHAFGSTAWRSEDVDSLSENYRKIVFDCAVRVAASDGKVSRSEMDALLEIGRNKLKLQYFHVDKVLKEIKQYMPGRKPALVRQGRMSATDFAYQTLGLKPGASAAEIKKAYRKLAMQNHPDRVPEDKKEESEERFKEIGDAYKILTAEL